MRSLLGLFTVLLLFSTKTNAQGIQDFSITPDLNYELGVTDESLYRNVNPPKPIYYEVNFAVAVKETCVLDVTGLPMFAHWNIEGVPTRMQQVKFYESVVVDITKYQIYRDAEEIIGKYLTEDQEYQGLVSAYYIRRVFPDK